MYDAVDATKIPANAQVAAGYVDGLYKWSDLWWERFSAATTLVRIAVFAQTNDGDFLDVERGNANPEQAPAWVTMRRNAGHRAPAVYMNIATWPQVRHAFATQKVAEPLYIVASWDGVATIPPIAGAFGKQYLNDEAAGYDLSVIGDIWPGVDHGIQLDPRRHDVHFDLITNKPVVFTNPAAVLGGTSHLVLASDFGDATVRVATFSLKTLLWTVTQHTLGRLLTAANIALPPDTNKVSLVLESGVCVGADVYA
jgi:hypothetical protein